jgi:hypothetical protein
LIKRYRKDLNTNKQLSNEIFPQNLKPRKNGIRKPKEKNTSSTIKVQKVNKIPKIKKPRQKKTKRQNYRVKNNIIDMLLEFLGIK